MKLYEISIQSPDEGNVVAWASAMADAKKIAKQMKDEWSASNDAAIKEIDFPTDKAGLLNWLNRNFTRDNG